MTASTIDDITRTITGIAAAELGVPAAELDPEADLRAIEGIDSVKVLRMVARIERAYDIELDDEDVFGIASVAGTAQVVREALDEQP